MSKAKHAPGQSFRKPDRRREVLDLIPEAQLREQVSILREAAKEVVDAWHGRDLAGAVGKLVAALEATKPEEQETSNQIAKRLIGEGSREHEISDAAEQKRRAEAFPDLLEALEAVMNSWRVICSGQGCDTLDLQEHRAAVAVIAKARGEA